MPQLADSIAFHARIEQGEVDRTLRLSGLQNLRLAINLVAQPHPDRFLYQDVPQRMAVSQLFRADPFPPELGPSDIVGGPPKWSRPLKPRTGCWELRIFLRATLLIVPVQSRMTTPSIIQPGYVPKQSAPTQTAPAAEEDPCTHNDPLKAYRKGQSATAHAPKPPPPVQTARVVTGPTETRFQDQDARIQAIEQSLEELKSQSEKRHQDLQQAHEEDSHNHAASVNDLRGQLTSLSSDFASQLRSSIDALQGAQTQQMAQVLSGFEGVKSFLSRRDRDPSDHAWMTGRTPDSQVPSPHWLMPVWGTVLMVSAMG